jgi:hypothetical protein
MRKSVGQTPTAERENKRNKKKCRTSSDIGAEQENHNVGRGPTLDRKGLKQNNFNDMDMFKEWKKEDYQKKL